MKFLLRLFLSAFLLCGQIVFAQTKNILVIPADLFNVCNNYYCFPEMSEIIAEDTIKQLNVSGNVTAPNLYIVRAKLNNGELKPNSDTVIYGYKTENKIYAEQLKIVADAFGTNSVLLISSSVPSDVNNTKRGIWEILEISSAFNSAHKFSLETKAILVDAETGIVIWSGDYTKNITNREDKFWARNSSQANAWLENLKMYSENLVSKEIAEGVSHRLFPKTLERNIKPSSELESDGSFFRLNKTNPSLNEPKEEPKENFGEIIYGI